MRILIITDALWRTDNGVGNSYSNIFKGMKDVKIYNICCQEGVSDNDVSSGCFQISESRLISNLLDRRIPSGIREERICSDAVKYNYSKSNNFIGIIKRSRLQILFWIRNLIWSVGDWKNEELTKFIDEVNPDLIFAQIQDKMYLNDLIEFIQTYTGKPLVSYVWDDVYSLRQFSLSPLFWVDRILQRKSIRRLMKRCDLLYTISKEQKEEYSKAFGVKTRLLYKGKHFIDRPLVLKKQDQVVKIVYTGNLYSGRYETILNICKKLHSCNSKQLKGQIYIYSATNLSKRQIEKLNIANSSFFMGRVPESEVEKIQMDADVLLHVEPFSLKGSLMCRLSFSTKLVDYFYHSKCIFAIGSYRCASMRYLKENDAAIVAYDLKEAAIQLENLLNNTSIIEEYSAKAWHCGCENHQIEDIQNGMIDDFNSILSGD